MDASPIYIVEVVRRNRVVTVTKRTADYDIAADNFSSKKRDPLLREVRMFKTSEEKGRVLLKYVDKSLRKQVHL